MDLVVWRIFLIHLLLLGSSLITTESALVGRTRCGKNDPWPEGRINSTSRLAAFRNAMNSIRFGKQSLAAFVVGTEDAHYSEYPTEHDQRRAFITGFTGSAGTAVVTRDQAALWTDGRYFLEADDVMDCNWSLMKKAVSGTPSISEWINSQLTRKGEYVGVDTSLVSSAFFEDFEKELKSLSKEALLQALPSSRNPVDFAWTDQPPQPTTIINAWPLTFAGVSWRQKVADLRTKMADKGVNAFVVTALDETAWLFNMRGTDVPYNPFFLSYVIVEMDTISLYILDKERRLTATPTDDASELTLAEHLGVTGKGQCLNPASSTCVQVKDYNQTSFEKDLGRVASKGKVWITHLANYAVFRAVQANFTVDKSPISLTKSIKNAVERIGMKRAYDRDSIAVIKFLSFLEKEIEGGETWTEISAAQELDRRRSELKYNRGISFATISCYGSNGALIHYRPNELTNKVIGTDSLYLIDSGGQYLDGTTDVTRTVHYGTPTDYEKECYTRVLKSAISLATLKWPEGLYGHQIDPFARYLLWEAGLIYRHGTGGGIGAYLSVHEGPSTIYQTIAPKISEEPLTGYQFYSDEPGYYEDGKFGIRLETIMMIQPFIPTYNTSGETFLKFIPITLVPFEPKMIDYEMLTIKELQWLNEYNAMIQEEILPKLKDDTLAFEWTKARIQHVDLPMTCGSRSHHAVLSSAFLTFLITVMYLGNII